ncbi:MAG: glycoside hydrolase family protein, partial [Planctomycetota bacterium]
MKSRKTERIIEASITPEKNYAKSLSGSRRTFIKTTAAVLTGIHLRQSSYGQTSSVNKTVPTLSDAPQLFVDLDRVERIDNIRQVFHSAVKHPENPVIRKVKPWENDRGTWGTVIYDHQEKIFKAWYGGSSGKKKEFSPGKLAECSVLCYATSNDGIHWERPNIGIYKVKGTKQNNVVISDNHHNGMAHWESALKDPMATDPQRQYKALGWSSYDWDGPMSGIYNMTSPDGLHWTHTPEPIFHYHPRPGTEDLGPVGDAQSLMIDTLKKRYVAYLRKLPNRAISTSKDFVNWEPPWICIKARPSEQVNTIYNHMGFVYGDRYLGFLTYFDRNPKNPLVTVRLITSRDGENWHRPDTHRPLIDVGEVGDWDRFNNLLTGGPPIRVGDQLYIYYRGLANRHGIHGHSQLKDNADRCGGGLGLATIRVDGFCSLDASYDGGTVTTTPYKIVGNQLHVNAKSDFGYLWAEILDRHNQPIAGFTRHHCQPLRSDGINQTIHWKENASLTKLNGRIIRLRFH